MLTASCIFIILGVLMIACGAVSALKERSAQEYRGRASATVVDIEAGAPDAAGLQAGIHDYYYPVVAFYAGGILCRARSLRGGNPCRYAVHDQVEVCYDEQDPTKCAILEKKRRVSRAGMLYYGGFALLFLGGIFFLLFATRG